MDIYRLALGTLESRQTQTVTPTLKLVGNSRALKRPVTVSDAELSALDDCSLFVVIHARSSELFGLTSIDVQC